MVSASTYVYRVGEREERHLRGVVRQVAACACAGERRLHQAGQVCWRSDGCHVGHCAERVFCS